MNRKKRLKILDSELVALFNNLQGTKIDLKNAWEAGFTPSFLVQAAFESLIGRAERCHNEIEALRADESRHQLTLQDVRPGQLVYVPEKGVVVAGETLALPHDHRSCVEVGTGEHKLLLQSVPVTLIRLSDVQKSATDRYEAPIEDIPDGAIVDISGFAVKRQVTGSAIEVRYLRNHWAEPGNDRVVQKTGEALGYWPVTQQQLRELTKDL